MTRNQARAAAVQAALVRLDELAGGGDLAEDTLAALRAGLDQRANRYRRRLDLLEAGEDGEVPVSRSYDAAVQARHAVIDAQREEILRWRDGGRLSDKSLRILERELDHEERALPGNR